jgi:hypothetical protein
MVTRKIAKSTSVTCTNAIIYLQNKIPKRKNVEVNVVHYDARSIKQFVT